AHGGVVEQWPGAGGVRQHDIELKLLELLGRDARLRQATEPGVDAVRGLARGDDSLHGGERRIHLGERGGVELERRRVARDRAQLPERRIFLAETHYSRKGRLSFQARAQAIACS